MPKKTAPTSEAVGDDQPAVKAAAKVAPKGEPVDLAKGDDPGPFDDLEPDTATEPAAQSEDDLDLDKPMTREEAEPELPTSMQAHSLRPLASSVQPHSLRNLDAPLVEEPERELPIFTPVHAMEQFEVAMGQYPNSCLKHMLAEWKSQEREARKFEERQRVRGDIP